MKFSARIPSLTIWGSSKNERKLNEIINNLPEFKGDSTILDSVNKLKLNKLLLVEQNMIVLLGDNLIEMEKRSEPIPEGLLLEYVKILYSDSGKEPSKVMDKLTALCTQALKNNWTSTSEKENEVRL